MAVLFADVQVASLVVLLVVIGAWLIGAWRQIRAEAATSRDGTDSFADRHPIKVVLVPVGLVAAFLIALALYLVLAWPGVD